MLTVVLLLPGLGAVIAITTAYLMMHYRIVEPKPWRCAGIGVTGFLLAFTCIIVTVLLIPLVPSG